MKFHPGILALCVVIFLTSESPAQFGGGPTPITQEPSEFCLFRQLRVERDLGSSDPYEIKTDCVFKSNSGGTRTARVNHVTLYQQVPLTQVWSTPSTAGTMLAPTSQYDFLATLELPPGPQIMGKAVDSQTLPGPGTLPPAEADYVGWNSGIAYCLWNDNSVAHLIQTARFHNKIGGLFALDFYLFDSSNGQWVHLKTVAINGNSRQLVGIDFVELMLSWENDQEFIVSEGLGDYGCRLKVEAKYADGEETIVKSDEQYIPLWWNNIF